MIELAIAIITIPLLALTAINIWVTVKCQRQSRAYLAGAAIHDNEARWLTSLSEPEFAKYAALFQPHEFVATRATGGLKTCRYCGLPFNPNSQHNHRSPCMTLAINQYDKDRTPKSRWTQIVASTPKTAP